MRLSPQMVQRDSRFASRFCNALAHATRTWRKARFVSTPTFRWVAACSVRCAAFCVLCAGCNVLKLLLLLATLAGMLVSCAVAMLWQCSTQRCVFIAAIPVCARRVYHFPPHRSARPVALSLVCAARSKTSGAPCDKMHHHVWAIHTGVGFGSCTHSACPLPQVRLLAM